MGPTPLPRLPHVSCFMHAASVAALACAGWLGSLAASAPDVWASEPLRFTYTNPLTFSDVPIAAADLDGDGTDDVVAGVAGLAVILKGDYLAPLTVRVTIPLEAGDLPAAAHDLDRDGRPDLITLRAADSTVAVYRNLGAMQFAAPERYQALTTTGGVLVGDLTGDGWSDLVVLPAYSSPRPIWTLLNRGDGTFIGGVQTTGGVLPFGAVADVNGDNRADLVVLANNPSTSLGSARLLIGVGDGSFQLGIPLGGTHLLLNVVMADFNQDGHSDLLLGGPLGPEVSLGTGTGLFTPSWADTSSGFFASNFAMPLMFGNFDSDANLDLVMFGRSGSCFSGGCAQAFCFPGNGDGTFQTAIRFSARHPNGGGQNFETVASVAGDFGGDGVTELAYSVRRGGDPQETHFARNNRADGFDLPLSLPIGLGGPNGPLRVRIAKATSVGRDVIILWDGQRTYLSQFISPVRISAPIFLAFGQPSDVSDLNGDGLDDVVIASSDTATVLLADGVGGFVMTAAYTGLGFQASAQVDGANGRDLIFSDVNRAVFARYNDGSAEFGSPMPLNLLVPLVTTSTVGLDLDDDGYDELLFGSKPGGFKARLHLHWNTIGIMAPADSFEMGLQYPNQSGSASPSSILRGDIDGNGARDLVVVLERSFDHSSGFSVIRGLGSRTFLPVEDYETTKDPREGVLHDFNHDGLDDVVIVCDNDNASGLVHLYQAMPGGSLQQLSSLTVEHYPTSIAHGDWNRDGSEDLLVANQFSQTLTLLRNLVPDPATVSTSVAMSLVTSSADADGVHLEWFTSSPAREFTLERASEPNAWRAIASIQTEGDGRIDGLDRTAAHGQRYGYRLAWLEQGSRQVGPETWIQVPGAASLRLAISSASTNPSRGTPQVALRLPTIDPVTVELFDTSSRRLATDSFTPPSPGRYTRALHTSGVLAPGIYLARVQQAGQSRSARLVILE